MKLKILFGLFFFMTASFLSAQDIHFEAQANKKEVTVNERFVVKFVLSYGKNSLSVDEPISLPDFGKLIKLNESQSRNFQIINGKVTNENGIEVLLVAEKEGEYTIGAASVVINGDRYRTRPLKIHVTKDTRSNIPGGQRIQGAFLSAEVSNENPYLNQEIILSVKIYARDYSLLRRMQNFREPVFSNLIASKIEEPVRNNEKQVLINGKTFISKELARYVVFPQKTGELSIDPFTLNLLLSSYYGAEEVTLGTEPVSIEVKKLPGGKPKNFSGAVGEFQLNAFLSDTIVKADDPVTLEWEIVGSGNLNTLKSPSVKVPENVDSYSPKKREAIEIYPTGMKGKIVESRVLVPHYGGDYSIAPITFNYFNPDSEEYQSVSSEGFQLTVKGPKPPVKDSVDTSQPEPEPELLADRSQSDSGTIKVPTAIPDGIIKAKNEVVKTVESGNIWFWSILGASILGLLGFLLIRRKGDDKDEKSDKQIRAEFRNEINVSLSNLKQLAKKNETSEFLSVQEEILTQIGMKYSQTELADFTETGVAEKLNTDYGDLSERWKTLLIQCKEAKYAFGASDLNLNQKFKETESLWREFRKQG